MSFLLSLVPILGKPVAEKLLGALSKKAKGAERLKEATDLMQKGATAIEALKQAFGNDFLKTLNEIKNGSGGYKFTYEAGTSDYIKIPEQDESAKYELLRDELNINLDRLSVQETKDYAELKNYFLGLMSVWQKRCVHYYGKQPDSVRTFEAIDLLLKGEKTNYKEIYQLLSSTGLGGIGALMVIAGVMLATGTGVGIFTAISIFLFGVPWMAVGALVLPGALLVMLSRKILKPGESISMSVGMAYKLLERLKANA